MLQQIFEARVSLFRRAEAGELAHGPELAAIAGRVYAARVRELAGERSITFVVNVCCVCGRVESVDRRERDGLKFLLALRPLLERGRERLLFPAFHRRL